MYWFMKSKLTGIKISPNGITLHEIILTSNIKEIYSTKTILYCLLYIIFGHYENIRKYDPGRREILSHQSRQTP